MIRAKLAMWENHADDGRRGRCLALMVRAEDLGSVPERMTAVVSADLSRIVIQPSDGCRGAKMCYFGQKTSMPYCASFYEASGLLTHASEALPAFELMDVELDEGPGPRLIHLPPVHKLPWPSRRSVVGSEDPADFARRALDARVASIVAYGLSNFSDNPLPAHIREHLPNGAFVEARRAALALSGVS